MSLQKRHESRAVNTKEFAVLKRNRVGGALHAIQQGNLAKHLAGLEHVEKDCLAAGRFRCDADTTRNDGIEAVAGIFLLKDRLIGIKTPRMRKAQELDHFVISKLPQQLVASKHFGINSRILRIYRHVLYTPARTLAPSRPSNQPIRS